MHVCILATKAERFATASWLLNFAVFCKKYDATYKHLIVDIFENSLSI